MSVGDEDGDVAVRTVVHRVAAFRVPANEPGCLQSLKSCPGRFACDHDFSLSCRLSAVYLVDIRCVGWRATAYGVESHPVLIDYSRQLWDVGDASTH